VEEKNMEIPQSTTPRKTSFWDFKNKKVYQTFSERIIDFLCGLLGSVLLYIICHFGDAALAYSSNLLFLTIPIYFIILFYMLYIRKYIFFGMLVMPAFILFALGFIFYGLKDLPG